MGYQVFLECGPKPILLGMRRQCLPEGVGTWLPSLRPGQADWQILLQSLGQLYIIGVKVDWSGFDKDYPRRRVVLPTYPFQRQRYWLETANDSGEPTESGQVVTQVKPNGAFSKKGKEMFEDGSGNSAGSGQVVTQVKPNRVSSKKGKKMLSTKLVKLLEPQRQQIIELLFCEATEETEKVFLGDRTPSLKEKTYFNGSEEPSQKTSPGKLLQPAEILQQLKGANGDRRKILTNYLQAQVAKILGTDRAQLPVERSLSELGMESLSAMELREKVKQELGADVHVKRLLGGMSLTQLTDEILRELSWESAGSL